MFKEDARVSDGRDGSGWIYQHIDTLEAASCMLRSGRAPVYTLLPTSLAGCCDGETGLAPSSLIGYARSGTERRLLTPSPLLIC